MAEPKPATPAMGDIIGKTRQRRLQRQQRGAPGLGAGCAVAGHAARLVEGVAQAAPAQRAPHPQQRHLVGTDDDAQRARQPG